MTRLPLLLAAAAVFAAAPLSAQATRLIDPLDPAYRDLQQLVDGGLIDRLTLAQRPLSRVAVARAVNLAAIRLAQRLPNPMLAGAPRGSENQRLTFYRDLIVSLRERLDLSDSTSGRPVPRVAPIRSITVDITNTDEPTRRVPRNNGLGSIDATLNTLLSNRQGRPLVDGTSTLVETNHSVESRYVGLAFTPRLSLLAPRDSGRRYDLRLQELELRILIRNLAVDIGREYVMWGQGRDVGLLNSNNSPPLDLIKLSSEAPFTFPWFLRHLGPTRFSIFYSDLGADQNFPHSYLVGYRGNAFPTSWFELGLSIYTKSGGHGAPPASATARLVDLLPFLDASAYNNVIGTRGHFEFSDHYAGFDGRLRFPALSTNLYWDVLLNDFDVRRLKSVFWEDAGHVFGLDLPPLSESGRLRASLEYHHTGIRYYEHHQFLSGQTLHETLTGDPLGPNGQGAYAYVDWYESLQRRFGIQFALERRSNDQYILIPEPNYGFRKVAVLPKEWQGRVLATWQLLPVQRQLGGLLQFGYERTRNFNFIGGDSRNGFLGRAALQYRFR